MDNKKKIICTGAVVSVIIVAVIVISLVLVYTRKPKDGADVQDTQQDVSLEDGIENDVDTDEGENTTTDESSNSSSTVVALDDEFLSQY